MGLSGRKVKQRIGNDPRNLSWADDAARFGSNYLSRFGWDASKGLGAEGEGRTSHLKVAQKLDMLGIGAAHQKDPNGIAWKQNRDFENLLKRLNAAGGEGGAEVEVKTEVSGFVSSTKEVQVEVKKEEKEKEDEMDVDEKKERKKEKKEKKDKEKKKDKDKEGKRKRSEVDGDEESGSQKKMKTEEASPTPQSSDSTPSEQPKKAFVPRHRAHRARAIAAKSISMKSSTHISEILGIAPESSTTSAAASGSISPAPPDQGKLTVISEDVPELEKITTSTKSVADYFKERLLAKANAKAQSSGSSASTPQPSATKDEEMDEAEEKPRGGLGFARVQWESQESTSVQSDTLRMGLSKFSSLMSSTFLSSTFSSSTSESTSPATEEKKETGEEDEKETEEQRKERKRLKKEEKARKKAEKEKRKAAKAEAATSEAKGGDAEDAGKEREKESKKKKKSKKEKKT
ncbi:hypothetical protein CC2G_009035 [Coprinopsis cinerea AmutBmut pab1-1]|nr:hypothetical protein CC2G_009035 [Coprinopsis cinerea AmutBmut pab1-1]